MKKPLTPFEQWMVKSNLKTIRETRAQPAQIIATLQANGYPRIAEAVKAKVAHVSPKRPRETDLGYARRIADTTKD